MNGAQTAAQQTQSEAGRNQLLKGQYQNASQNGYNQGENNLDQMILENSSGGQQALQPLAQQWSGLTGALGNTVSAGNTAAAQGAATTAATAAAAQGAYGTANTNFQTGLNNQVTDTQAKQSDLMNRIAAQEKTGVFDPDVAAALGIQGGQNLYNVDLSKANQGFNPAMITAANAATPEQYAQAQALAQLSGQQSSNFLPMTNVKSAGTAVSPLVDQSQIAQQLAAAKDQFGNLTGSQFQALAPDFTQLSNMTPLADAAPTNASGVYNYISQLQALEASNPALKDAFEGSGQVGQAYQGLTNWQGLYSALNPTKVAQITGQTTSPVPVKVGGPGRQVIPR